MKLKTNANLVDFLKQVQKCRYDVYLDTEDGDRLNLKSVLSQYLFVVLAEQKEIWNNTAVMCQGSDMEILSEYLEKDRNV